MTGRQLAGWRFIESEREPSNQRLSGPQGSRNATIAFRGSDKLTPTPADSEPDGQTQCKKRLSYSVWIERSDSSNRDRTILSSSELLKYCYPTRSSSAPSPAPGFRAVAVDVGLTGFRRRPRHQPLVFTSSYRDRSCDTRRPPTNRDTERPAQHRPEPSESKRQSANQGGHRRHVTIR
jgi:hypothetical protein